MTENYITLSLETHLFFSRIMKEHSLFLEAGFPCKENELIKKADSFRQEFELLLNDVVNLSNGRINEPILTSNELVTEFTPDAEKQTECLSGIPIDRELTQMEKNLRSISCNENNREIFRMVHRLNERSLDLLDGLIALKEEILQKVSEGNLFTFNYPLLIRHIIREAKLYRFTIDDLMQNRQVSYRRLFGTEAFWNRIMMEHALFIRGLLDPSEEELIKTADNFATDYRKLLEMAKARDCMATNMLTKESLEETLKYQEFKKAGTKGSLSCDIASLILPLLADHVLREANHYIRILKYEQMWEDN